MLVPISMDIAQPTQQEKTAAFAQELAEKRVVKHYTGQLKRHRILDGITEGLLYAAILFSPWAFGTTQNWAVWVMNSGGYLLGILLLAKWIIRWRTGYRPAKWGEPITGFGGKHIPDAGPTKIKNPGTEPGLRWGKITTRALAVLTVMILGYCLVSALNARAVFDEPALGFHYYDNYRPWLPHSYDATSTWFVFWTYLGLAFHFWATRDWLLTKSRGDLSRHSETAGQASQSISDRRVKLFPGMSPRPSPVRSDSLGQWHLPDRLRRLLWVLCLNATLLAVEGMIQRVSGTNKLLWLVIPTINYSNDTQFGPYAYRSNAAQYFNLIWPVCLGFWLVLRHQNKESWDSRSKTGSSPHILLLLGAALMVIAAMITLSRAGALVAFVEFGISLIILWLSHRRKSYRLAAAIAIVTASILAVFVWLAWQQLYPRFKLALRGDTSNREEIYATAREMQKDFLVWGSGPGTFCSLYPLYRSKPDMEWSAYLHNDWWETLITFGPVGSVLVLLALLFTLLPWFYVTGLRMHWSFVALLWLALGGCLLHAIGDMPFQIHSVLFHFLLLCCLSSCASRHD